MGWPANNKYRWLKTVFPTCVHRQPLLLFFCCYYCWFYCVVEYGFSQWVHPKEQQTRETTACICVYIYIELVSPTGLPVKQTTFYETRSTQWFHPSRNIMLVVLCFMFVSMLFPQFGVASICFWLLRVYPRFPFVCFEHGFSQWVCPPCICIFILCTHGSYTVCIV